MRSLKHLILVIKNRLIPLHQTQNLSIVVDGVCVWSNGKDAERNTVIAFVDSGEPFICQIIGNVTTELMDQLQVDIKRDAGIL